MPDATVTLRVYTGANAGTESGAVTGVGFLSTDSATDDPDDAEVAPGSNSYEKWCRLKIGAANDHSISNFWVERSGDLPDGVTIKMGVTDTAATPVATASTVATTTMAEGRRYFFDTGEYSETGATTRYVVLQEQVASDADSGAIETQAIEFGWTQT